MSINDIWNTLYDSVIFDFILFEWFIWFLFVYLKGKLVVTYILGCIHWLWICLFERWHVDANLVVDQSPLGNITDTIHIFLNKYAVWNKLLHIDKLLPRMRYLRRPFKTILECIVFITNHASFLLSIPLNSDQKTRHTIPPVAPFNTDASLLNILFGWTTFPWSIILLLSAVKRSLYVIYGAFA